MNIQTIKAVMLGHAVGDALGVPVEFCDREELDGNPVTDMKGFGTYPYPAGCWSDDTSMSLAALDSLADDKMDFDEIMHNFGKWIEQDAYTPTGEAFDAGRTCVNAIINYFANKKSIFDCGMIGERSNGNGSLMRIHPFALYGIAKEMPQDEYLQLLHTASALTHAHERSKMACGIYGLILKRILLHADKTAVLDGLAEAQTLYLDNTENIHYQRLFSPDFPKFSRKEIRSTGYVVDTLEAAIWCLLTTDSYEACVLKAVNLGEDTDTVAAIAGGLAGALYGYDAIPKKWLDTLYRRDYIEEMCERAASAW